MTSAPQLLVATATVKDKDGVGLEVLRISSLFSAFFSGAMARPVFSFLRCLLEFLKVFVGDLSLSLCKVGKEAVLVFDCLACRC